MVTDIYVKLNYHWLHINKALGNFQKSDNNNVNNNKRTRTKFIALRQRLWVQKECTVSKPPNICFA